MNVPRPPVHDEQPFYYLARATLVKDERDRPAFWQGVALDVTVRHEAVAALRHLESRFGATAATGEGERDRPAG